MHKLIRQNVKYAAQTYKGGNKDPLNHTLAIQKMDINTQHIHQFKNTIKSRETLCYKIKRQRPTKVNKSPVK